MNANCTHTQVPATVSASLEARLAPYPKVSRAVLEEQATEVQDLTARATSPSDDRPQRLSLVQDLKLLFAALGAGNSIIPLGDNGHATRLLAEYARTLRKQ